MQEIDRKIAVNSGIERGIRVVQRQTIFVQDDVFDPMHAILNVLLRDNYLAGNQ